MGRSRGRISALDDLRLAPGQLVIAAYRNSPAVWELKTLRGSHCLLEPRSDSMVLASCRSRGTARRPATHVVRCRAAFMTGCALHVLVDTHD
jgi:hypothetical protein